MRAGAALAMIGLGCATLARPTIVIAQSPAERAAITAWDDSLQRVTTVPALNRLEKSSHVGNDSTDIRHALYLLRRGTLVPQRGDIERALMVLDWLTVAHRTWPWPYYAIAREFAALRHDTAFVTNSAGHVEGESHTEAAWRQFQEALQADPTFAPARRTVIHYLVAEGDRELRSHERAVLALLLQAAEPEADVYLVQGRALRIDQRYDSALAVFDHSLRAGGDRSRLDLEIARTRYAIHDTAGARTAYWDGVQSMTATGREMYRFDLEWIIDPDSVAIFDKVPADSIPQWFQRFWDSRDAAAANLPGERLQEHLRRFVYTQANYRLREPWRRDQFFQRVEYEFDDVVSCIPSYSAIYDLLARLQPSHPDDLRNREYILDHRGVIYMRHGEPLRIVHGPPPIPLGAGVPLTAMTDMYLSMSFNEGWQYWLDGRVRVLNFRGSKSLGQYAATTMTGFLPVKGYTSAWVARAGLSPKIDSAIYVLQHDPQPTCTHEVETAIAVSREDSRASALTDSDTPPLLAPWNAFIQTFALGHARDQSEELLTTFTIPGNKLHPTRTSRGQVEYAVNFRIVAWNGKTGETATMDSLRTFTYPDTLKGDQHVSGWFEVGLHAGDWQVAVKMKEDADTAGAYALKPHVILDGGLSLALSDIVTGRENGPGWMAPDNQVFPLDVQDAWPVGGNVQLYYEVRGPKAGDSYRTTVEIRPTDSTSKPGPRIATTDASNGDITYVRKSAGLGTLPPGTYRLIVTIQVGSQTARREREILVVKN